jgi:hypothetical protein
MVYTVDPDKFLEIFVYKLGTVVRDDPRSRLEIFFHSPLQDDFNIGLGPQLSDLPVPY